VYIDLFTVDGEGLGSVDVSLYLNAFSFQFHVGVIDPNC